VSITIEKLSELTFEQRALLELRLKQKRAQAAKRQSIPRRKETDFCPLSYAQQRLWFLDQLETDNSFYNGSIAIRLNGQLNAHALRQALSEVVRRHEALRTTFAEVDGQPVQLISPPGAINVPLTDLSHLPDDQRQPHALTLVAQEARLPFDISAGPLLRATLLRLETEEHVLLVTMHHIISDGWSLGVMVKEIKALYAAFAAGAESPLKELEIQYADFAAWQGEWLTGDVLDQQLEYWKEQLQGAPPVLELPTDRPRPAIQSYRGARHAFSLSEQLTTALTQLSQREGCTLFMTLLAAFQVLLSRYSGQEDVVVGSPIANRNRSEIEGLIGFFVNTLALRTDLTGEPSFREVLRRVKEITLGAYAHQDVPFEKLVEELQPERSLSHQPLFQVMFALQNVPDEPFELTGLKLSPVAIDEETARFDLSLNLAERENEIVGTLQYKTDLFDAATVERMTGNFLTLLESIVANPEQSIALLPLLAEEERRRIVQEWNETARSYPREVCLHQLFESQVRRTPDSIAVVFEEERLTYAELNQRANRLAHRLRRSGIAADTTVAVRLERSADMVVALFGILKAGGAYLPLDPAYPQERLAFMLADLHVPVLITQQNLLDSLPAYDGQVVCLDALRESLAQESADNPSTPLVPENLAYVIYTSGSTGRPKAAMNTHRAICNRLLWMQEAFRLDAADSVLQKTPFSFDVSVWEFFWPLLVGARLVVARPGGHQDSAYLAQVIAREQITTLHFVPSMLRAFLEEPNLVRRSSLKRVICSGEALPSELQEQFCASVDAELHNLYGPTEAAVDVTAFKCDAASHHRTVPIGRPIANTQIYLLDRHFQPVPTGVAGELYIGGVSLARGYSNRPDLTAERFIPDPFSREPGARLYRTGDIVRHLPDGNLLFIGRSDHQVKVRGFRIELGEIEELLRQHQQVKEAIVIARDDKHRGKQLLGYVVARDEVGAQAADDLGEQLKDYLRERLPEYMVPLSISLLDALPLSAHGKVNLLALPSPDLTGVETQENFVAPSNMLELRLAQIWQELLGAHAVSVTANFFNLGGHSLLATQLASRVRREFSVELPLRRVFEKPTVAGLAEIIRETSAANVTAAIPEMARVSREGRLTLSYAQQRLWFLEQLEPGNATYNIPTALHLNGRIDLEALGRAINEIVRRHEALRTTFAELDGQPLQLISPPSALNIPLTDLSHLPDTEHQPHALSLAAHEARLPFDLAAGPLLRCSLLRLQQDEHLLLITMHHIISDGWSLGVMVREIKALYAAFAAGQQSPLPDLEIQYADFAAWQREWLTGEVLNTQLRYWEEQLSGAPPVLELPIDRPRPAVQSYRGARQEFKLTPELSQELRELSQREGCTLFMTLLAAFQMLLSRYSGQEDVVVGTPIANRNRSEIEGLIGFFVNTLALRTDLSGEPSFREVLKRVREATLGAYGHQDVPFEKLVERLQPERSLSHQPLFQVMFALQNAPAESLSIPGLTWSHVAAESGTSKFDLVFLLTETDAGSVSGFIEYSTDLFEAATIDRLAGHFRNLLAGVVADPSKPLSDLPLLTMGERQQLLVEWNDTHRDYSSAQCLHQLFEAQVERTPDAIALVHEDQRLSYAELNSRANQLAHHLKAQGVGPEVFVGILLERTPEMVVSLLAVLKAGGAYVPVDLEYPAERLSFMLEDARVQVVLTKSRLVGRLPALTAKVLCIDVEEAEIARLRTENPESAVVSENLAYLIYTSGSTGRPKGVAITHRSACVLMCWAREQFSDAELAGVLASTSVCFDLTAFELYVPLSWGGRVILAEDALQLPELKAAREVTLVNTVPSAMSELVRAGALPEGVRTVNLAGEPLSNELVAQIYKHQQVTRVNDLYGPSEDTTYTTHALRSGVGRATIGRPIANTQIYILNERMRAVPVGVAGELYIGGDGLARGYWQRPELTAERFIPNPFGDEAGTRLYKTGDLARYLADGSIEFLGRLDYQVKIRGYRIELGEVEAALRQHGSVREALVLATEEAANGKRLVAYVVVDETQPLTGDDLREIVRRKLPEYMTPSSFILLDELPLTPNGKIDRRALPAPTQVRHELAVSFVAPRTTAEQVIAEMWTQVLGVDRVGISDNFFELGGHSLLATQIMSRLREAFRVELPLRQLFRQPTVDGLVNQIAGEWGSREIVEEIAETLKQVELFSETELYSLLDAQMQDTK